MSAENKESFIKVGVIGCGNIFLSHSQAYPDHLHAVLTAFYDRIKNRADNWFKRMKTYMEYVKEAAELKEEPEDEILLKKYGVFNEHARVYNSVEELLRNVDAVDICTPNYAHAPYAIWALKKGISVMTEKPPARCSLETRWILEAQKESKAFYQLNENFLWKTSVRTLHELISEGKIGQIKLIKTRLGHGGPSWGWNNHFLNPSLSGGGCLSDMGIHAIGYGFGVIGRDYEIVRVKSVFMKSGTTPERRLMDSDGLNEYYLKKFMVEDDAAIICILKHNSANIEITWEIETSWARSFQEFYIEGDKGILTVERDERNKQIICYYPPGTDLNVKNRESIEGRSIIEIPPQGRDDHQLEVIDFFNRISKNPPQKPLLDAEWAHKMQMIISAAYLSNLRQYYTESDDAPWITPDELEKFYQNIIKSNVPREILIDEIVWTFMTPFTARYFNEDEEMQQDLTEIL